jgi:hypothetical protein
MTKFFKVALQILKIVTLIAPLIEGIIKDVKKAIEEAKK